VKLGRPWCILILARIALDSQGRARTLYWNIDDANAIDIGVYNRLVLADGVPSIDLTWDVEPWDPSRNGDILVDETDAVHLFIGSPRAVDHWLLSEEGALTGAEEMSRPDDFAGRLGELFDAEIGPGGSFYVACTGNNNGAPSRS